MSSSRPPEPAGAAGLLPDGLPLDLVFDLLSNSRRRRALRYLEGRSEPAELGPLAEALAARELDKPVSSLSSDERKRLYIALYQSHLPKLDDADVVRYERARGTIEPTPYVADLVAYLDRVAALDRETARTGGSADRPAVGSLARAVSRCIPSV